MVCSRNENGNGVIITHNIGYNCHDTIIEACSTCKYCQPFSESTSIQPSPGSTMTARNLGWNTFNHAVSFHNFIWFQLKIQPHIWQPQERVRLLHLSTVAPWNGTENCMSTWCWMTLPPPSSCQCGGQRAADSECWWLVAGGAGWRWPGQARAT